jgi:hypothetical protein
MQKVNFCHFHHPLLRNPNKALRRAGTSLKRTADDSGNIRLIR